MIETHVLDVVETVEIVFHLPLLLDSLRRPLVASVAFDRRADEATSCNTKCCTRQSVFCTELGRLLATNKLLHKFAGTCECCLVIKDIASNKSSRSPDSSRLPCARLRTRIHRAQKHACCTDTSKFIECRTVTWTPDSSKCTADKCTTIRQRCCTRQNDFAEFTDALSVFRV